MKYVPIMCFMALMGCAAPTTKPPVYVMKCVQSEGTLLCVAQPAPAVEASAQ